MLKTKQRSRRQIKDLQTDLEVINPIESKKVLGGDWYNGWDSWYYDQDGITFTYGGNDDWNMDPYGNYNDPGTWGEDYGSSGGGGGSEVSPQELLENPSFAELTWLANNVSVQELGRMIDNKNFALEKAAPIPGAGTNGLGDAFRHALWSAADAADIGIQRATAFHTLHETANPDNMGGVTNAMDLFNNNWGYNWFSQHGDPVSNMTQFITDFNTAVANGKIQTHP
jgi:hypothetical protein